MATSPNRDTRCRNKRRNECPPGQGATYCVNQLQFSTRQYCEYRAHILHTIPLWMVISRPWKTVHGVCSPRGNQPSTISRYRGGYRNTLWPFLPWTGSPSPCPNHVPTGMPSKHNRALGPPRANTASRSSCLLSPIAVEASRRMCPEYTDILGIAR